MRQPEARPAGSLLVACWVPNRLRATSQSHSDRWTATLPCVLPRCLKPCGPVRMDRDGGTGTQLRQHAPPAAARRPVVRERDIGLADMWQTSRDGLKRVGLERGLTVGRGGSMGRSGRPSLGNETNIQADVNSDCAAARREGKLRGCGGCGTGAARGGWLQRQRRAGLGLAQAVVRHQGARQRHGVRVQRPAVDHEARALQHGERAACGGAGAGARAQGGRRARRRMPHKPGRNTSQGSGALQARPRRHPPPSGAPPGSPLGAPTAVTKSSSTSRAPSEAALSAPPASSRARYWRKVAPRLLSPRSRSAAALRSCGAIKVRSRGRR